MSTSLLYHAFGIRGYQYRSTDYYEGQVVFHIEAPRQKLKCPGCNSSDVTRHGAVERQFKSVPIGGKPVLIRFAVPRVECPHCKVRRQVELGFADPRRSYTRSFERYALDLCRQMTIQDVAQHLNVGWDTIKDIQKRSLQQRYKKPKLKRVRQIAIDEICIGGGHRYLTIVLDLERGAVVFVGQGKGADALLPFWKRLRASGAKVQAVASDMSAAYIKAVSENLSSAVHVLDRFHVVKLFNEKLSNLRRDLHRQAVDDLHKQVLKGTRWLLLKNPENLDEKRDERTRLDEALALNRPLATAYYMKEELRQYWEQPDKATAQRFLASWIERAQISGIRMLQQFAKTLQGHLFGLLAWYDYPISTGPLEGVNNKIKTLQRQAYGYRDYEFFQLKIYALHECKYALLG